ncbi:MAG: glycosyltransferase [Clostridiales bacterium]|uniref:bifunctional glycosyltransferase family 2/GtrA family protein n=1 Tax=Clostridium sp. N3C TaxID=1776758 RepID=UPI00092E0061|nr:bifunctional glycosyltransferase family 2/GtrA family protein [Clostridium sp. N3C]NLZ48031.1 glycosyltransferase [Clostridiales bacterium]SCN24184.1 glycosyltransferase [Clostridium sp. N3C]
MVILIPAYEPSKKLIKLVCELIYVCDYDIVVVDDGSGENYRYIFDSISNLGCTVLTHEKNMGKGAALKTGFKYIQETNEARGVVTADCDGQHLTKDIINVAEAIKEHKNYVVLGTRRFVGKVPFRSRFGNSVTRAVFTFASGVKVYDTQTGLRGFSIDMLPWLCDIPGDRFEYEMNMLLETLPAGYSFYEINIDTVYHEQNQSSHFHPLKDSFRIYLPIIKFSMSSILSGVIDFLLLAVLQLYTSNLFLSVIGARLCSASFNYTINRIYVFSKFKDASIKRSLPRYFILAAFIMLVNYGVIDIYYSLLGLSLFLAKILTEVTIFLFSYWAQRRFVFSK